MDASVDHFPDTPGTESTPSLVIALKTLSGPLRLRLFGYYCRQLCPFNRVNSRLWECLNTLRDIEYFEGYPENMISVKSTY